MLRLSTPSRRQVGRARDPVPLSLKETASTTAGGFGVMAVGSGVHWSREREEAARRSSENTQIAAQRALKDPRVSIPRTRTPQTHARPEVAGPPPPPHWGAPGPPPPQWSEQGPPPTQWWAPGPPPPQWCVPAPPPLSHRGPVEPPRTQPSLSPLQVKAEQVRLLTLLRSMHPSIALNQLCNALAYFGGIPNAPPPRDGVFPESIRANGSGGHFIAWIAEIFPSILNGRVQRYEIAFAPKSKGIPHNYKPRRSKGTEQTRSAEGQSGLLEVTSSSGDGSGDDETQDASHVGNTAPRAEPRQTELARDSKDANDRALQRRLRRNPTGRARGRPKGSKNKSKGDAQETTPLAQEIMSAGQGRPRPTVHPDPDPEVSGAYTDFHVLTGSDIPDPAKPRGRGGRPKGSKNKNTRAKPAWSGEAAGRNEPRQEAAETSTSNFPQSSHNHGPGSQPPTAPLATSTENSFKAPRTASQKRKVLPDAHVLSAQHSQLNGGSAATTVTPGQQSAASPAKRRRTSKASPGPSTTAVPTPFTETSPVEDVVLFSLKPPGTQPSQPQATVAAGGGERAENMSKQPRQTQKSSSIPLDNSNEANSTSAIFSNQRNGSFLSHDVDMGVFHTAEPNAAEAAVQSFHPLSEAASEGLQPSSENGHGLDYQNYGQPGQVRQH